jgi:type II secretory pathway component PulJ
MRAENMKQRHFLGRLNGPLHRPCSKNVLGFSLVELMVALVLSLFLIGGAITTFTAARTTTAETETLSRAQENIRFASDYLIRDLRNAGFRDETTLTFGQLVEIQNEFAAIANGGIVVRYAGRGSCGHVLSSTPELKVIENRYRVENGNLICEGTELGTTYDVDGNLTVTRSRTVTLASDVVEMEFRFLDVNGLPNTVSECSFPEPDPSDPNTFLDPDCMGVSIHLRFSGRAERIVGLNVSFRNLILDRLYGRS